MKVVTAAALAASERQSATLQSFLDGFQILEPPKIREWDEEADTQRYIEKQAALGRDIPAVPELAGLDQFESFGAILARMES